ncbi:hypothetical protein SARC_03680 [Sphaeroforma arctica JP610]|uniref:TRAF-type domain-containing protein n=1 Tax=Sphaeroforma arctica JP610 TaxID=667725 RepID=A0A0L0G4Y2_9EUKA|nr:hypothetical protein SARC_03680 [Sphaeroforma arctica JP610]KNC84087.1 hypothetical protein SARC_03680 [Sphaeroforma arctica JP610]|eukprot:XP_014157989.1 hypothetical protein SARC_03680 [Sphaeroforma arctica JP610]
MDDSLELFSSAVPSAFSKDDLEPVPAALSAVGGVDSGRCTFYDVTLAEKLAEYIRRSYAQVMLTFKEPKNRPQPETLEKTWKEMETMLMKTAEVAKPDRDKRGVVVIKRSLELWVSEKKGTLSRMFSAMKSKDSNESEIAAYQAKIDRLPHTDHNSVYSEEASNALAIQLLDICGSYLEHCRVEWDDSDDMDKHISECSFRPFSCESPECGVMVSVKNYPDHDSVCPWKRLSCEQGCGLVLQRQEMKKHMTTVCPRKPISCPYKRLGCDAALVLETLEDHLSTATDTHLWLAVLLLDKQDTYIQSLQQKMDELMDIVESTEQDLKEQHSVKVRAIEKQMSSLKSSISSHSSTTKKEVARVKEEQDRIRTQYRVGKI